MTVSYTCNEETGQWQTVTSECVLPEGACQNGDTETRKIPYIVKENGVSVTKYRTQKRTCNNCSWGEWETVPEEEGEEGSCPSGYTYHSSTGKCCRYSVSKQSAKAGVTVRGCTLPDLSTLAYPGQARCSGSVSASSCPFMTCTVSASNLQADVANSAGEKTVSANSLVCRNGSLVYIENGTVYNLNSMMASFTYASCVSDCVDPK